MGTRMLEDAVCACSRAMLPNIATSPPLPMGISSLRLDQATSRMRAADNVMSTLSTAAKAVFTTDFDARGGLAEHSPSARVVFKEELTNVVETFVRPANLSRRFAVWDFSCAKGYGSDFRTWSLTRCDVDVATSPVCPSPSPQAPLDSVSHFPRTLLLELGSLSSLSYHKRETKPRASSKSSSGTIHFVPSHCRISSKQIPSTSRECPRQPLLLCSNHATS